MHKRGQITYFIIIGLMLILIFSVLFYANKIDSKKITREAKVAQEIPLEIQPIKNYVESCLEDELESVVEMVSLQGGYYGVSPNYGQC
jgi:hypothetical protein